MATNPFETNKSSTNLMINLTSPRVGGSWPIILILSHATTNWHLLSWKADPAASLVFSKDGWRPDWLMKKVFKQPGCEMGIGSSGSNYIASQHHVSEVIGKSPLNLMRRPWHFLRHSCYTSTQSEVTEILYWGKNALVLGEQDRKNADFFKAGNDLFLRRKVSFHYWKFFQLQ